jgi:hypothetical protein
MERKQLFQLYLIWIFSIVMTGIFCHCSQSSVLIIPKSTNLRTPALHMCIASPDSRPKFPKTNGLNKSSLLLILSLHH